MKTHGASQANSAASTSANRPHEAQAKNQTSNRTQTNGQSGANKSGTDRPAEAQLKSASANPQAKEVQQTVQSQAVANSSSGNGKQVDVLG
jgi:hypothetical protein